MAYSWEEAIVEIARQLKRMNDRAEPIKHGRWSEKLYCSNLTGYDYAVICSECEKPTYRQFAEPTPNYCPNCGAQMMDEVEE